MTNGNIEGSRGARKMESMALGQRKPWPVIQFRPYPAVIIFHRENSCNAGKYHHFLTSK